MNLVAGTKLGPYEITAPIGASGMGEVYDAKDSKLKREVALKVLPEAFAAWAAARWLFYTERCLEAQKEDSGQYLCSKGFGT